MTLMEARDKLQKDLNQLVSQVDNVVKSLGIPIIREPKTDNPLWIGVREIDLRYQIPVKNVMKFFEALRDGKVLATKCPKCGTVYFPPQFDCPKCMVSGLEWVEMPNEGELLTYTIINVKPPSFAQFSDYIVGVARMSNGVNVLAWVNAKDVKVGMKVKLRVARREHDEYLMYELVPCDK